MADAELVPIPNDWLARFNPPSWVVNHKASSLWVARRNFFAVQYAYIRGERDLILHNDTLIERRLELVKVHEPHARNDVTLHVTYPRQFLDPNQARLGVLQDPVVGAILGQRWKGFELRWKKLLRKGGNGLATLWEAEFEDGFRLPMVIKMDLDPNSTAEFLKEIKWHDRYKDASHITQRLDLEALAQQHHTDGRFDNRVDLERQIRAQAQPILILEYAQHGNLRDLLRNIETHKIRPTSAALWQIWEQMVFAVAEVAYQMEFRSRWKTNIIEEMNRAQKTGPQHLEAFFQTMSKVPSSHDVHFDLEEMNMLLFEAAEPGGCPTLKFHDFGYWSYNMRKVWEEGDEVSYWRKRRFAKWCRFLPEQASKDWDKMMFPSPDGDWKFTSEELEHGSKVAGRYGSWSNVFIIGRTMQGIISRMIHELPFIPKKVDPDPVPTYGWGIMHRKRGKKEAPLRPEDNVQLRHIVAQCMYERPAHRPSIINLLRQVMQARLAGQMRLDHDTKKFWSKALGPPPPLPENTEGLFEGVEINPPSNGVILNSNATMTAGGHAQEQEVYADAQSPPADSQENNAEPQADGQGTGSTTHLDVQSQSENSEPQFQTAQEQASQAPAVSASEERASPEVPRTRAPSRDIAEDLGITVGFEKRRKRSLAAVAAANRASTAESDPRRRKKQLTRRARNQTESSSLREPKRGGLAPIIRNDDEAPVSRAERLASVSNRLRSAQEGLRSEPRPAIHPLFGAELPPWRQRSPKGDIPGMEW